MAKKLLGYKLREGHPGGILAGASGIAVTPGAIYSAERFGERELAVLLRDNLLVEAVEEDSKPAPVAAPVEKDKDK
jgi:hypothetical protein